MTARKTHGFARRTVAPDPRSERQRFATRQEDPMPRRNTKSSRSLRRRADGRRAAHNRRAHIINRQRTQGADADRVAELLGLIRPVEEDDR